MYTKQQLKKDLKKVNDKKGLKDLFEKYQKAGKTDHIIRCSELQKKSAKNKQEKIYQEILDYLVINKVELKNDKDEPTSTEV